MTITDFDKSPLEGTIMNERSLSPRTNPVSSDLSPSSPYDFVIVGGGSAGAALAARLSEDPGVSVALIEAGDRPPPREEMPVACATLQLDPETDWMMSGDPGNGGRGFRNRRMPVPRGKMLGGSSGINYMVFVRGHPGDFDHWAELGAEGWSYDEVLPCFMRMEQVAPTNEASIDHGLRGFDGPVGVGIRSPVIPAARDFVRRSEEHTSELQSPC